MWNQLMYEIVTTLTPIAAAGVIALLGVLIRHVTTLTKSIKNPVAGKTIEMALYDLSSIVRTVVYSLEQSVVGPAKKAGKWDQSVAQQVKQQAMEEIDKLLPAETKSVLAKGIPDLTALISNLIESEVFGIHS